MRFVYSRRARRELDSLLAQMDDQHAALALYDRIEDTLSELTAHTFEGREVVLRRGGKRIRVWLVPSVWLYYERRPRGLLFVYSVCHTSRRPIVR